MTYECGEPCRSKIHGDNTGLRFDAQPDRLYLSSGKSMPINPTP